MWKLLSALMLSIALVGAAFVQSTPAATGLKGKYYDDFTRPDGIIMFDPADLVMTRIDTIIDFWNAVDCYYRWHPAASTNWYGVCSTGFIRIDMAGDYAFGTLGVLGVGSARSNVGE